MKAKIISKPVKWPFVLIFAASIAVCLLMARYVAFRELPTILLFLPLIWAFMILPPAGMIISAVVVVAARVSVEYIQDRTFRGQFQAAPVAEALFPIMLYVAIGAAIYLYRRRQTILMERLVESKSREAMAQLAGGLAHDFNNILSVVLGTAQLMQYNEKLDEQARKDVGSIMMAGNQAAEMVRAMLSFSRSSAANFQLQDLNEVVGQQMKLIEPSIRKILKKYEYSEEFLPVKVDLSQMGRLLTNLCMNARDAMPEGGTLTITTSKERIEDRDHACLSISDTGVGMDPRLQKQVFQPFYTTRANSGGMGLGLTIVQSIVNAHGGKLSLSSEVGKGSTFKVCLPMAQLGTTEPQK